MQLPPAEPWRGEQGSGTTARRCPPAPGRPGPQPGQGRARLGCCQALPHRQGFLPSSPPAWAAAGPGQIQGAGWQGHLGEPPDSLLPSNPSARRPLARPSLIPPCAPAPAHPPPALPTASLTPEPPSLPSPAAPAAAAAGPPSPARRRRRLRAAAGQCRRCRPAAVPLARGASRGSASAVTGKGRCHLTPRPPRAPMARAALSPGAPARPCRDPSAPRRGRHPQDSSPLPFAHPRLLWRRGPGCRCPRRAPCPQPPPLPGVDVLLVWGGWSSLRKTPYSFAVAGVTLAS